MEHMKRAGTAAQTFASSSSSTAAAAHARSAAITAAIFTGQLQECLGDRKGARETFASASSGSDVDPYASLSLANSTFKDVYTAEDAARENILRDCFNAYKDVMKRFPQNVYAANGLGMVLAEQGRLDAAKAAFKAIREADQHALNVAINLAHTHAATGDHTDALQLYHVAARRMMEETDPSAGLANGDANLAADIVQTLVYQARSHMEAKEFEAAIAVLQRGLLLSPSDVRVRYILAYAQAEEALRIITLDVSKRTAEQVGQAVSYVKAAAHSFGWLKQHADGYVIHTYNAMVTVGIRYSTYG
jgi:RNA polymerase-associated protein CTR9